MSENVQRLRSTLQELHDELDAIDALDPQVRKLLEDAKDEMEAALMREEPESLEHQTLVEQLDGIGRQFDESHPALAKIVGNLIDVLGQMGI